MTKSNISVVIAISTIFSILLTSIAITGESSALNPASKKLNDRASELDKESEQAKKMVTTQKHLQRA